MIRFHAESEETIVALVRAKEDFGCTKTVGPGGKTAINPFKVPSIATSATATTGSAAAPTAAAFAQALLGLIG